MAKKLIKNLADVCDYFGAWDHTNDALSCRIYKTTTCGAWAKVSEEAMLRKETWIGHYKKGRKNGLWKCIGVRKNGIAWIPLSKAPQAVREFFWPWESCTDAAYIAGELNRIFDGKTEVKEKGGFNVPFGKRLVFYCGSIVEGVDQYADATPVRLPCKPEQLDRAIQEVEREVESIWNQTHGCKVCAITWSKELGYKVKYQAGETAVHDNCPECRGEGEII